MRVLIVTRAAIGGAARHVLDVVGGLAGGHEITVLASPSENPRYLDRLRDSGAKVVVFLLPRRVSPRLDLAALAVVRELLRREEYDVVHAHTAKAGAFVRLARRDTPVVYSPHGFYHHYPTARPTARRAAFLAERFLARHADVLALCADWEADAARREGLRPRGEIVTIPNGVPLPDPLPDGERDRVRRDLGVTEGQALVLMVGRLKAPKDPLTFLDAAGRVGDEARFVLVGDGPLHAECRARAPAGAVVAGSREDAANILRAADVAVLATSFEAAPYTLLEAMAACVPAVASDVPGNREVLGDAGVLVPRRDPVRLAEAVTRLVRDTAEARAIGARARDRAGRLYTPERMLEATERAWETAGRRAG
ncbi:MAG: glycosyltransferase [Planctomycetota bacterium]|jgi:glycosyltransferase involved in cell wall biosynthesis